MGLKKWLKGFRKKDSDWLSESFKEESIKTTSVPETFHLKEFSPFGYKTTWFALHTSDIEGVAAMFEAADLSTIAMVKNDWLLLQTNSENMVDYNQLKKLLKNSETYRDFLLEIEKRGSMDQPLKELLEELSRRYQHAYYFSSNRISDCYGWVKASNGKLIRCFEFIGDYGVVLNQGELSDEELGLTLHFERLNLQIAEGIDDYTMPTEEDVIEIASAWSINPLDN